MKPRAPQVYYEADKVKNLKAELARGMKIKCTKCSLKGAALGCYVKSCRSSYHVVICARDMSRGRMTSLCFVRLFLQSNSQTRSLDLIVVYLKLSPNQKQNLLNFVR